MYSLYVASFDKNGGIYHYEISGKEITKKQFVPLDRPMYFVTGGGKMYVLLRDVGGESAVVSFDIDKDGNLTNQSVPISTKGSIACHLAVDGEVYVAHYGSGSLFKSPDLSVKFSEKSKMHFVGFTPDGKCLCVCDLGLDKIYLFDKNLALISETKLKEGSGPRHLCFDKAGKYAYCACELSSEVVSLEYSDGKFKLLGTMPTLSDCKGENHPAAIRISGDRLYVSNRGADAISVFALKDSAPSLIKNVSCCGKCPRDIFLQDNLLVCANQESDNVSVFELKNDDLIDFMTEIKVKAPICAVLKR